MLGYLLFYVYLVLALSSVCAAGVALLRRDYETPGVMLGVFLLSLIGLSANYKHFLRIFSALYNIEWMG